MEESFITIPSVGRGRTPDSASPVHESIPSICVRSFFCTHFVGRSIEAIVCLLKPSRFGSKIQSTVEGSSDLTSLAGIIDGNTRLSNGVGMTQSKPESIEQIRERIHKMSDAELRKHGRAARNLSDPKKTSGPPNPAFQVQLDEVSAEWRRRHPSGLGRRRPRMPDL